nr:ribosomal protein S18 [Dinophyceae sp. MRD-151]
MFTKKYPFQALSLVRSENFIYVYKKSVLPSTLPFSINYKNVYLLRRYLGVTGKILPRHTTKLTAKDHRAMAKAIRQARRIGLLPFVWLTHLANLFKNLILTRPVGLEPTTLDFGNLRSTN